MSTLDLTDTDASRMSVNDDMSIGKGFELGRVHDAYNLLSVAFGVEMNEMLTQNTMLLK